MDDIIINLLPIFLFFGLGIFLREIKFADTGHADFLVKLVFYVALPALVLNKLSSTDLDPEKFSLPAVNILINLGCMLTTLILARVLSLKRETIGTLLICTATANNLFMYPFVLYGMGDKAFSDLVMLDLGNSITTSIIAYGIALVYRDGSARPGPIMLKVAMTPLLWAVMVALTSRILFMPLPNAALNFAGTLGQLAIPLILIALGLSFSPRLSDMKLAFLAICLRSFIGLLIGTILAGLFGFSGVTRTVIMLSAAAPLGFSSIALVSLGRLNMQLASSAVSISILAGLFYIPFMMYLLQS